ncbi:MAG TPA: helix-turn-helix transcriptional regulator [Geobacteraceae bacterium]|nr:helix-turn-helix transcriptional regulator [Geobacteraceae bacterium]
MAKRIVPSTLPPPQELRNAEILGQFIRARRTQSGFTLHEAAGFCGIATGTLEKLERASGDVRLSNVLSVCSMLGIVITIDVKKG